jgi:aminopeptidase N
VDTDLRWDLLTQLVARGGGGLTEIEAESARDATASGERRAATCRAAIATAESKAATWECIVSGQLSNALLRATLAGFALADHAELLAPYTDRYFTALEQLAGSWPSELTQAFAKLAYPATAVSNDTLTRTDEYLATAAAPAWLQRLVLEARDELARTLRAQQKDLASAEEHVPGLVGVPGDEVVGIGVEGDVPSVATDRAVLTEAVRLTGRSDRDPGGR